MSSTTLTPPPAADRETPAAGDPGAETAASTSRPVPAPPMHEDIAHDPREHEADLDAAVVRSLDMVPPKPWAKRVLFACLFLLGVGAAVLILTPWQQSVSGSGRVVPYDAMSRPQTVEAQIPGRIVGWNVQEGQAVKAGQLLGRIEDIDSKFLDRDQERRIRQQQAALAQRLTEAQGRAQRIESQIANLTDSREASIAIAGERIRQSREREQIARKSLQISEQGLAVVERVTQASAKERAAQAVDRIAQSRQDLAAAEIALTTARINRDRVRELYQKELRSKRDDELAEQDMISRQAAFDKAKAQVEIAEREAKVVNLTQDEAELRRQQGQNAVLQARNNVEIALRDIAALSNDRIKVTNDTAAAINSAESNLQSVRETIQSIRESQAKLDVELSNLSRRVEQQVIRAPLNGRVVRIRVGGAGETVKSGDVLATIMPDTGDQAVEMTLAGFDTPLVAVGRPVRLQFNGWPAVQISGFPRAAYGTFAGRVAVIDAIDNGTGGYRVIIKPDAEAIADREEHAWPKPALLRPGTEAVGWVILDRVPLWYELWRRFNAFPPSVQQDPSKPYQDGKGKDGGEEGGKGGKGGKAKTGDIKIPKAY